MTFKFIFCDQGVLITVHHWIGDGFLSMRRFVSSQSCQDVVKKPKLDNHSYKCQASFTCVDCSKTFNVPVEWKGHTSCVSEAEKYQKALYKGKKKQGGLSGPRGAKSGKATDDVKDKSDAVEGASKDGAEKNLPEDGTVEETVLRPKGNSDSPVADESTKEDVQQKKVQKEEKKKKKKRRKANETEDTSANEVIPNKETKVTKKQESDPADDKGKGKTGDKADTDDVPLAETSLSKKEKKEKKNEKKRDGGVDSSQTGGPPLADVRPSSAPATGKTDLGEVRFPGNDTSNEAPARKKKKEKSRSKKEKSEAVLSSQEETLGTETSKADKKRKWPGVEEGEETSSHETKKAKKERKRKEKKGKTETVEGSEAVNS